MAKVLITGIGGFIGAHTLQHILEKTDWDIVGVDSWEHKGTPERVEQIMAGHPEWWKRLTIITHDLWVLFPDRTKERIGTCDYILNIAADSHVDRSIEDPVPFVANNVAIALTVLEFARDYKPKVFIQISTDEVYGPAPKGVNHKEWSTIVPSNPYSASKAAQEAIAISYWRTYGVPVVITNTMNNFGEMQDPEKYIAKIIRNVESGEPVPVHGKLIGEVPTFGSRFYLHARNHADALLFLLKREPTPYQEDVAMLPDRYNVVGEEEVDNMVLAQKVAELVGKPLNWELVDHHFARPGHDRRYALDGAKLAALGWKPPVPLWDSMKKYVDWTLKNRTWL